MQKKGIIAVAVAGLLFGAYAVATPYITLSQMKSAVDKQDSEAIAEYIDFPSVRASLKDQLNAVMAAEMSKQGMQDNPFAAVGVALAGAMTDRMVEVYVSPAGLRQMMAGEAPNSKTRPGTDGGAGGQDGKSQKKPLANATTAYEGVSKFVVTVKGEKGKTVRVILRRSGLDWKVTDIVLPMPS
jgi:hypothetical protein